MHYLTSNVWMSVIYDKGNSHCQICHFTARKRSLRRLCFYRCLSVHRADVHGRERACVVVVGRGACMGYYTMTSDETREQTSKTISGNSIGKIKKSKGVRSWSWLHDIFI